MIVEIGTGTYSTATDSEITQLSLVTRTTCGPLLGTGTGIHSAAAGPGPGRDQPEPSWKCFQVRRKVGHAP
eukprot:2644244-Rhodomonas_salina.1